MKKAFKWEKIAIAGTVATALLAGVTPVLAAEVEKKDTDTKVGFVEDSHVSSPELDGKLSLIWHPKEFNFGTTHTVSPTDAYYPLLPLDANNKIVAKYLVVSDQRFDKGIAATGWKLTAQASVLKASNPTDATNPETLKDASNVFASYLMGNNAGTGTTTIANEKRAYQWDSTDNNVKPETDGAITAKENLPSGNEVSVAQNIEIPADGTTSVIVMESGSTLFDGKYAAQLNSILLKVPAGSATSGKQYKGTITWTLVDGL